MQPRNAGDDLQAIEEGRSSLRTSSSTTSDLRHAGRRQRMRSMEGAPTLLRHLQEPDARRAGVSALNREGIEATGADVTRCRDALAASGELRTQTRARRSRDVASHRRRPTRVLPPERPRDHMTRFRNCCTTSRSGVTPPTAAAAQNLSTSQGSSPGETSSASSTIRTARRPGAGRGRIKAQHAKGKRPRASAHSPSTKGRSRRIFVEHRCHDFGMEREVVAGDGVVTGYGRSTAGSRSCSAQDFTVFGGTLSEAHAERSARSWTTR